ncbi:hypothetical protein AWB81_07450 [Caballeronia arationis]|nr:hypothetical protein AWB81_07450 [Caballeronia arationis]
MDNPCRRRCRFYLLVLNRRGDGAASLARGANHGCQQRCRRTGLGTVSANRLELLRSTMDTELRDAWSGKEYDRGLHVAIEGFLRFAQGHGVDLRSISRETIAQYVGELRTQPRRANANVVRIDSGGFLSNATLQQRLTAVRLLFEFLVDEGLIRTTPVSRGRYTASCHFGARGERSLIQSLRRATSDTDAPGSNVCSTSCRLNSRAKLGRLPGASHLLSTISATLVPIKTFDGNQITPFTAARRTADVRRIQRRRSGRLCWLWSATNLNVTGACWRLPMMRRFVGRNCASFVAAISIPPTGCCVSERRRPRVTGSVSCRIPVGAK